MREANRRHFEIRRGFLADYFYVSRLPLWVNVRRALIHILTRSPVGLSGVTDVPLTNGVDITMLEAHTEDQTFERYEHPRKTKSRVRPHPRMGAFDVSSVRSSCAPVDRTCGRDGSAASAGRTRNARTRAGLAATSTGGF